MAYNSFPYTDLHELNLDYLLNKSKEIEGNVQTTADNVRAAADSAETAHNYAASAQLRANAAADSAETAHNYAASAQLRANEAAASVEAARAAAGDPKTFTAATQLTDTTKIYVYVGETGAYTYGHFYYYQDGSWHDGGVYGTWSTDDALSDVSTNAVQNKVITAAVNGLEEALNSICNTVYDDTRYISDFAQGTLATANGNPTGSSITIRSTVIVPDAALQGFVAASGYKFLAYGYVRDENNVTTYLGYWRDGVFSTATGLAAYYVTSLDIAPLLTAGANVIRLCMRHSDDSDIVPAEKVNIGTRTRIPIENQNRLNALEPEVEEMITEVETLLDNAKHSSECLTDLVSAQKYISEKWHFGFIDVAQSMGLGNAFVIPGTKHIWSGSNANDLTQKEIWMSDGVHPFRGDGVTDMYARTISEQLAMIPPSYKNGIGITTPTIWSGRTFLWMGTSVPAGSDPDAGSGTGATYPALVASILSASVVNRARGSSCVRINASTGHYTGMLFSHFIRALSRTVNECDNIADNWNSIKDEITYAPDTLSAANVETMKNHSFERLLLPYLDGTQTMPDLFVFDHGHNDVRPKGIDGKNDLWIDPSSDLITSGVLADDTYMTANNYANLKLALNDDLSGIANIAGFAAKLNRNCFKGAVNFIMTVILRYNPYARVVIVSDYN